MDFEILTQTRKVVETIIDDGQGFPGGGSRADDQVWRYNIEHSSLRYSGMTGNATTHTSQ